MTKFSNTATALLLAGSFIFCGCGFAGKVRSGVTLDGTYIGGMSYAEAEETVRQRNAAQIPSFTVRAPSGGYAVEFSVTDNVSELVRGAKRGETLVSQTTRVWVDAEDAMEKICRENAHDAVDAEVIFTAAGFTYIREKNGVYCDYTGSLRGALGALAEGRAESGLIVREFAPKITERMLRERTKKLASFTTRFDGTNVARVHNIALCAARIAGTTLEAGGEFSFNRTVGKRTEENGFEMAAVILDGEFVPGVGGGVCQASTTLMNAALRAGLCVTESRAHSLSVGYVPPSLDAMVSEYSDLKFENPYEFPVYLNARMGKNSVTFDIYGAPDGRTYVTESRVLYRIAPPPAEIVEGGEDKVIRAEREGLASESYLLVYDPDGKLVGRRRLRKDTYAAVQGIWQSGQTANGAEPEGEGEERVPAADGENGGQR